MQGPISSPLIQDFPFFLLYILWNETLLVWDVGTTTTRPSYNTECMGEGMLSQISKGEIAAVSFCKSIYAKSV